VRLIVGLITTANTGVTDVKTLLTLALILAGSAHAGTITLPNPSVKTVFLQTLYADPTLVTLRVTLRGVTYVGKANSMDWQNNGAPLTAKNGAEIWASHMVYRTVKVTAHSGRVGISHYRRHVKAGKLTLPPRG
jgi:hypothetical protein